MHIIMIRTTILMFLLLLRRHVSCAFLPSSPFMMLSLSHSSSRHQQKLQLQNHMTLSAGAASATGNYYSYYLYSRYTTAAKMSNIVTEETFHQVQGITCREVKIDIDVVGPVTILEATAESQNYLVDMALATEEEKEIIISTAGASVDNGDNSNSLTLIDPYGAVLWPAASAVANHLLTTYKDVFDTTQSGTINDHNDIQNMTLLELGAGTGLVSLAAALAGFSKVMATDYENVPLQLLQFAASNINQYDNTTTSNPKNSYETIQEKARKLSNIETSLFDICNHNVPLPVADVVVAADIMYEPKTGIAMASRVVEALKAGSRVIVGCSPGRPGRPKFLEKLRELIPHANIEFIEVDGMTCSGPRNELICGKNSSSISSTPQLLKVALLDLSPKMLHV